MSSLITPFCSDTTPVSGPIIGMIDRAASSVSQSLTDRITRSAMPTLAGSSVAFTFGMWMSPCALLSIVRPFSRIAARCLPRAMKVTSYPAFANRPPKKPPTPPEPIMTIFMKGIIGCAANPGTPSTVGRHLVQQAVRLDEVDDVLEAVARLQVREDERAHAAHLLRITLHHLERRAKHGRQVDLVDDEQIAWRRLARDPGAHLHHTD